MREAKEGLTPSLGPGWCFEQGGQGGFWGGEAWITGRQLLSYTAYPSVIHSRLPLAHSIVGEVSHLPLNAHSPPLSSLLCAPGKLSCLKEPWCWAPPLPSRSSQWEVSTGDGRHKEKGVGVLTPWLPLCWTAGGLCPSTESLNPCQAAFSDSFSSQFLIRAPGLAPLDGRMVTAPILASPKVTHPLYSPPPPSL